MDEFLRRVHDVLEALVGDGAVAWFTLALAEGKVGNPLVLTIHVKHGEAHKQWLVFLSQELLDDRAYAPEALDLVWPKVLAGAHAALAEAKCCDG